MAPRVLETPADGSARAEDSAYLTSQLITCIGNKRALLPFIGEALAIVRRELRADRLDLMDAFAGSGVVSRYFKRFARRLISNDLETYAGVIAHCYLANADAIDFKSLQAAHAEICADTERNQIDTGIIRSNYAPSDDRNIQPGERVFYTVENARRLDTFRTLIGDLPAWLQPFLLAPLLSAASVHANTSGVFKGFYKDRSSGVGRFGGSAGDALARIMGRVELPFPVFSRHNSEVAVHCRDANQLVRTIGPVDVAYFDPPYNQHPYGSNYFMLNLLCDYQRPQRVSPVSGIPADWKRSDYNRPGAAAKTMADLVENTDARYILVSYSDEGFIEPDAMRDILARRGRVRVLERAYNTFRGSRNLQNRSLHVKEQLFLVRCR
ncbi:MAG: DNA adenine methylase [Planctomycetes bacterium]|nr:DNA adenine methylase [Planctomycetota bacterium]